MKSVPNSEPHTVATNVQNSGPPSASVVTPVAIAVRLMLATIHTAPRCRTLP